MKKPSTMIIGAAALAAAVGVAITGASLANAATRSGSSNSTGYAAPQQGGYGQMPPGQNGQVPDGQMPNGQAPDPHKAFHPGETLLTGTTKDKVTAAARAKEPSATIERVETDAEGVYEAHMVRTDGTHVTVHVGKDFTVTSVEVQGSGGPGQGAPPAGAPSGAPSGSATTSGSGTT